MPPRIGHNSTQKSLWKWWGHVAHLMCRTPPISQKIKTKTRRVLSLGHFPFPKTRPPFNCNYLVMKVFYLSAKFQGQARQQINDYWSKFRFLSFSSWDNKVVIWDQDIQLNCYCFEGEQRQTEIFIDTTNSINIFLLLASLFLFKIFIQFHFICSHSGHRLMGSRLMLSAFNCYHIEKVPYIQHWLAQSDHIKWRLL
jgi:hypothetical protein